MSRQATSFVLGYHGCDLQLAKDVVLGKTRLKKSNNKYDWLGEGIYFWEADPNRAVEWAKEQASRGKIKTPAALGAVIDLGNCLDLLTRADLDLVAEAHARFVEDAELVGRPLPRNYDPDGQEGNDLLLRNLDCAVLNYLHGLIEDSEESEFGMPAFDTVRAVFSEGQELYSGSGFRRMSHTQIAVRTPACIKGFFLT